MIPVGIALLGSGLRAPAIILLGWFVPRGIASVPYLLVVIGEIGDVGKEYPLSIGVLNGSSKNHPHGHRQSTSGFGETECLTQFTIMSSSAAGSAGCVMAGRLSERSPNRCWVEAGTDYPPDNLPDQLQDGLAGVAYNDKRFIWNNLRHRSAATRQAPDTRPDKLYQQGRVMAAVRRSTA